MVSIAMPTERPTHDQPQSPFFNTPREIRDLIYCFVLVKETPISPQRTSHRLEERSILRLLRTCRRIRQEAMKVYFSGNSFRFFDDGELDLIELPRFFASVPEDTLQHCAHVSLEASLGPKHNRECFARYCFGRVEVDLATLTAVGTEQSSCCETESIELVIAKEAVQGALGTLRKGGIQGLVDASDRAAFGREVGRAFCASFENLHPDYGD